MTACSEGVSGSFTATGLRFPAFLHVRPTAGAWKAPPPPQLISPDRAAASASAVRHFATSNRRPRRIVCVTHTGAHTALAAGVYLPVCPSTKLKVKLSCVTFQFKFNFQRSSSIILVFFSFFYTLDDSTSPIAPVFTHLILIPGFSGAENDISIVIFVSSMFAAPCRKSFLGGANTWLWMMSLLWVWELLFITFW